MADKQHKTMQIIGAGISGLTSALTLHKLGHKVLLIDKGRAVGGRLATRYHESQGIRRYIDTASHYIELGDDTPQFNSLLRDHLIAQPTNNKILGRSGINSVPKQLADQLHNVLILTSHKVQSLEYSTQTRLFAIKTSHGNQQDTYEVEAVVLTAPVPQSIELLGHFPRLSEVLRQAPAYHRCLLLLLWPKCPMTPSMFRQSQAVDRLVFQKHIASNQDPIPIAVHATYEWSNSHYSLSDQKIKDLLIGAIAIDPNDYEKIQVKRWGQAQPMESHYSSRKGYEFDNDASLVVCSDALGVGDIHHAGEAGINAAKEMSGRTLASKPMM